MDGTSAEDLSDSQVEASLETQFNILGDLEETFSASSIQADIDRDTGKVTMDTKVFCLLRMMPPCPMQV